MPTTSADLPTLFNRVARTLKENQESLNEADSYNHDHGTNMVKNFQVITKAVKEKKDEPPAAQLAHASQVLSQKARSGSAQLYAQGLAQAAQQMEGQRAITPENAMSLVQALLGGPAGGASADFAGWEAGKAPSLRQPQGGEGRVQPAAPVRQPSQPASAGSAGADPMAELMSALLSGAAGGQGQRPQAAGNAGVDPMAELMSALLSGAAGGQGPLPQGRAPAGSDQMSDLLAALLGGAAGGQASRQPAAGEGGLDLNTLLTAGMAYMQANQQGASPLEALAQAVVAGSQMSSSSHHTQSGQLVASTLLNTIGKLFGGKKR